MVSPFFVPEKVQFSSVFKICPQNDNFSVKKLCFFVKFLAEFKSLFMFLGLLFKKRCFWLLFDVSKLTSSA